MASKYPLLVKVQTVDFKDLDFCANTSFKPRSVTCVETSNLYIFVGVASGTVYVFSRDKLSFKFMIPFTGGKVCCISCVDSEKDIAIGSIRGQVSIYKLTDQANGTTNSVKDPRSSQLSFFKHLNTLEHHKGNEITELHWSPNGRYLFVGDSKGLVSQADIGSLEEFPRPVSFSQVILKLKSRVIQIHFVFPYLAVCTVSAVFLCDIENEDFVRVQFESVRDIRATGVALLLLDAKSGSKTVEVRLYVSEMTSGILHCFSLQGQLLESKKIEMNSFLTRNPVPTFDPVCTEYRPASKLNDTPPVVSFGKLMLSDSNLLISISNNNIYVIDPNGMELILWNDDYQKIQNAKLLSNYAFIWTGSKVQVVSFTQVLPYSEQLFTAGGIIPFERWIRHILTSINWKEKENNTEIENHFKKLIRGNHIWEEISDFQIAVAGIVPFKLIDETVAPDTPKINPLLCSCNKLLRHLDTFAKLKVDSSAATNDEMTQEHSKICDLVWSTVQEIYSSRNLKCNHVHPTDNLTLAEVMRDVRGFCSEIESWKLPEEVCLCVELAEMKLMEKRFFYFLTHMKKFHYNACPFPHYEQEDQIQYFSAFSSSQRASPHWLREFGLSDVRVKCDGFLADLILFVLPLFSAEIRVKLVKDIQNSSPDFCVWLLTSTFYNCPQGSPYELQITSLFLPSPPGFEFMKSILSSIYGDLAQDDLRHLAASLHHVITIIFYNCGSDTKKNVSTLLLSLFPLKHWYKSQVEIKLEELMTLNPSLLKFFKLACLQYCQDVETCQCGIPLQFIQKASLPSILNTLQEFVLKYSLSLAAPQGDKNDTAKLEGLQSDPNFQFAIKTGILDFYASLENVNLRGAETSPFILEVILRSPLFAYSFLERIDTPLDLVNPSLLLEKRQYIMENKCCQLCGDSLRLPVDFIPIQVDFIGMWLLNKSKSMEEFISYIERNPQFNALGFFSLKLYQYAASWKPGLTGDINENGSDVALVFTRYSQPNGKITGREGNYDGKLEVPWLV